jgi:opacity protein-like surface antigen
MDEKKQLIAWLCRIAVMCYFGDIGQKKTVAFQCIDKKRGSKMSKAAAILLFGLMVVVCSVSSAIAATPYVRGSAALSVPGDSKLTARSYDTGYALAGAVGLDNGQYRLEAELGYQNNGIKNTHTAVSMTTYMGNVFFDVDLPLAPLKPFVTAGAGLANIDEEQSSGGTVGDTVFAWQLGAGAGFAVAPLVHVDVQYRYFATSDPELADQKTYTMNTHNLLLGLRVGF